MNQGNALISNATIPPIEILEAASPVIFRQWVLRPASGSARGYRGGLGSIYEIELLEERAEAFRFGKSDRFAPQGGAGGAAGAMNVVANEQVDGRKTPLWVSSVVGMRLRKGQALYLETTGGGGYSDPFHCETAAVARDVLRGYLSGETATENVGPASQECSR